MNSIILFIPYLLTVITLAFAVIRKLQTEKLGSVPVKDHSFTMAIVFTIIMVFMLLPMPERGSLWSMLFMTH